MLFLKERVGDIQWTRLIGTALDISWLSWPCRIISIQTCPPHFLALSQQPANLRNGPSNQFADHLVS